MAAYKAYTDYLFHRIRGSKDLSPITARSYQSSFDLIFDVMHPDQSAELKAEASTIIAAKKAGKAPESKDVSAYLGSFFPFVTSLRNAVMKDDFPLKVNCGSYDVAILPSSKISVSSPFTKRQHPSFNAETYQYYDRDEYREVLTQYPPLPVKKRHSRASSHKKALVNLAKQNAAGKNGRYRSTAAQKVIKGYATLIEILTGIKSIATGSA